MNCKNCGYPLFSNDKFCKNCGQEVVKESDIEPVVTENKVDNGPIAPVINNGPIADPTKPSLDNVEPVQVETPKQEVEFSYDQAPSAEVKEASIPAINDGPIAPVIGEGNGMSLPNIDAKKIEPPAVSYDKIDGPKGVSNVMSMMGTPKPVEEPPTTQPIPDFNAPKEEKSFEMPVQEVQQVQEQPQAPQLANVNQGLPTIPKDKKENKSTVIIPTKPKPTNAQEPMNNNQNFNNQNFNNQNFNQPMNNNYNNGYGNQQYNNGYNNGYNNPQFNNQNNMQQPMMQEQKKSNPILIIIILAILGVAGYFGYKYFIKDANKVATKNVSFSGYEFKVPESYKTKITSNTLAVYDDSAILSFSFVNGSYSDLSTALVLENFNAAGNTATYMGEKEKNGNKYHLYKVVIQEKNAYVGYTANGVTKIVCFGVEPKSGTALPSDDYLDKAVDVAMSPTFNGSSNIESNVVDEETTATTAQEALKGEEKSTGDINDEDVYEDIYVNITLEEINE